ncbi:uncharacterized protein LOC122652570 [Telopea speciosissima]|uniref:uncharacterized protein LOC122652570 n=1 Tax=Telopea speciosissima TaxID=54955 RepID=UPI001CC4ACFB|nr:uncharacterized protein LOC122652570 [Telopea speciosissima]
MAKEAQLDNLIKRLEAIVVKGPSQVNQVPAYAKVLKDLFTQKRKTKVPKKAFLATNVSSVFSQHMMAKCKDPGYPTISCVIGNTKIDHTLLDLGVSVNLLPYSMYQQLGLGDLKPTTITLQLANRSVKILEGMIEDVLIKVIKVGEFFLPVYFIILDTQPVSNIRDQISIILGRPFLTTSDALINCRNGHMKLSFGNTSVDFNIFKLDKQPTLNEDVHMIHEIPYWIETNFDIDFDSRFNECMEQLGDTDDDFFSEVYSLQTLLEPIGPLSTSLPKPSIEEPPKLNLKVLPSHLRYAFLGQNQTLPIVIASELTLSQ